jgi:hypothetical protein
MKLKQAIGDAEKQKEDIDRAIHQYEEAHDELKLEEIE